MKKISIYVKDMNYDPSSYYRIIQYTSKIPDCDFFYHPQLSEKQYKKYMPISKKSLFVKVYLQISIMIKMLFALVEDSKNKVDIIIISRRIINRCFPKIYILLLESLREKGVKIYWDFDDHILESKEVTQSTFDFLAEISDKIIVTHSFLRELVLEKYRDKVVLLPTTDGDIYLKYDRVIHKNRMELLKKEIRMIWVGTSVNLNFLVPLIPILDYIAVSLQKDIILNIVCNEKIEINTKKLVINNIKWTRDVALVSMYDAHIGLMPLIDSEFTKGKGGFKLIQYLSAALPIIGSNVGFNKDVCDDSVGKLLDDIYNRDDLLLTIKNIVDNWEALSLNALERWHQNFSFEKSLNFWKKLLLD